MSEIVQIASELIYAEGNDRKEFDEAKLWELAESIRDSSLAQPPTVRPKPDGRYALVAGERRVRAMKLLKWEFIPCIVRDLKDEEASAIMLMENVARVDLGPIEEGQSYQRRVDEFGWLPKDIARKAGVPISRVKQRLKLLGLAPAIQALVTAGALPLGHADLIATLETDHQMAALCLYEKGATDLTLFSQVVTNLRHADDQISMFALEAYVMEQLVQLNQAVAEIPTSATLPPVRKTNTMTGSEVLHTYIQDLLGAGFDSEAAAVGNALDVLVKCNWLKPPRKVG